jgi:serine phosphatase RsbU (regulator of sigma subunit)
MFPNFTSREMYGFERLLARAQSGPGTSARKMQEWILADIRDFVGIAEQHDDMTLVIIIAGQEVS